jgi:hypothetical protein
MEISDRREFIHSFCKNYPRTISMKCLNKNLVELNKKFKIIRYEKVASREEKTGYSAFFTIEMSPPKILGIDFGTYQITFPTHVQYRNIFNVTGGTFSGKNSLGAIHPNVYKKYSSRFSLCIGDDIQPIIDKFYKVGDFSGIASTIFNMFTTASQHDHLFAYYLSKEVAKCDVCDEYIIYQHRDQMVEQSHDRMCEKCKKL